MNDFDFIHLESINSTNSYLKELSRVKKLPQGFGVYSDYQSFGRGQKGSSWESEAGKNLLFSVILFPEKLEANRQFILSQIISLAVKDVLDEESPDFAIKWPNDIYYKNKKIAGILIENELVDSFISQSVIGVGLNLNQEIFESEAPNPISLKQITGKNYEIEVFFRKIFIRLEYYFNLLKEQSSIGNIRREYRNSLFRKDGLHNYKDENHFFKAEILDVEESGTLVLKKESGDIGKYFFKEVQFVL